MVLRIKKRFRNLTVFFILPIAVAFSLQLKTFLLPECGSFDYNDDANLTFPNLAVARSIMKEGNLPLINYFNSFGTPIVGDVTTFPFALHSFTYWFMSDPHAMMANRFIIAVLTIVLLTMFFRSHMSLCSASICALLSFLTPGFLHNYAHHHYQTSLLYFILLLISQRNFIKHSSLKNYSYTVLLFILLNLSVSENLVFIMIPFFVFYHLILSNFKPDKRFYLFCLAIFSGFTFYLPEIPSFIRNVLLSVRVDHQYSSSFDALSLLGGFIGLNFPVLMVIIGIIGFKYIFRERNETSDFYLTLWLGVIPTFIVILFLTFRNVWWAIPYVKATDITRIFWFSNVFFLMAIGKGLEHVHEINSKHIICIIFIGTIPSFLLSSLGYRGSIPHTFIVPSLFFLWFVPLLILVVIIFFIKNTQLINNKNSIFRVFLIKTLSIAVLLTQIPTVYYKFGYNYLLYCGIDHYFSPIANATFVPNEFIPYMKPYNRMAAYAHSVRGMDLRAAHFSILGSGSGVILTNKKFSEYLNGMNTIEIESEGATATYHFKPPWDINFLNRLGIRYIIQPEVLSDNDDMNRAGLKYLVTHRGFSLFENIFNPTPVYYILHNEIIYVQNIFFHGNTITIDLPPISESTDLIATFIDLPGYIARVDGVNKKIFHDADQLIRVKINPGDRILNISYSPYNISYVILGIILSFSIPLTAWLLYKITSEKPS